jgi:Tfp pilus assembly protein PilV
MRKGFTLIETLVALILLQFGMLAVVAVSAVAARDLAIARRIEQAQAAARNRVELVRANHCPAAGVFTAAGAAMTEHWRVEAAGLRRVIVDSVDYSLPNGRRGLVVVRVGMLCRA